MDPPEVVHEKLEQMGYCAPSWDKYQLDKFSVPLITSSQTSGGTLSKKQLFMVKIWPRIESFFEEDEDATVTAYARTMRINGSLSRAFSILFRNEAHTQIWQFLLEKRLEHGVNGLRNARLRQTWAFQDPEEIVEGKFHYSKNFETQSHSIKYKFNRDRNALAKAKQNFLREIKTNLIECYDSNDTIVTTKNGHVFEKGKELEFEEAGNYLTWVVSLRTVDKDQLPSLRSWKVKLNSSSHDIHTSNSRTSRRKSLNPFEENPDTFTDSEEIEMNRQIVEQKINEYLDFVWPSVRNFYLEIDEDNQVTSLAVNTWKNGRPMRVLEFHVDTLNERNRWRFLFEMSIANAGQSKRQWAGVKPRLGDSLVDIRAYDSYEKRGTSSKNGEDSTDISKGFYKRWFLTEIQSKLVKAYAQVGFFELTPETFDQNFFDFGRDVEFSDDGDLITWSVSVQKIFKYPERNVPSHVWCYGLTDNYVPRPPKSPFDDDNYSETENELEKVSDISTCDADISQASVWTTCSTTGNPGSRGRANKLRTLARSFVRPMTKTPSWLSGTVFRSSTRRRGNKSATNLDSGAVP